MEYFAPRRSLLNPKFEHYKLQPLEEDEILTRYPLVHHPSQVAVSGKSPLSFEEVSSRITHNHLAVLSEYGLATYVDKYMKIVLVNLNESPPTFTVIYEIPVPVQQGHDEPFIHNEYPVALLASPSLVVASDGHGLLYMLRLDGSQRSATTSGTYRLSSGAPFRLHSIFNTGDSTDTPDIAIVSSSFRGPFEAQPEFATASARVGQKSIRFDVWAVKLDLSVRGTDIKTLDVAWHRRGDSAPVYISRHTASGSFLIVGGSVYEEADTSLPKPYEPTPEEIAPIPRLDENLDAKSAAAADPPPYSWIQTADGLTVAFPLPSSTPKTQIKVLFTPSTLTLHINTSIKTSVPIPRYSAKKLWDFISPSTSYWTWDREAEHEFGLLTLHLDKQHEGTRWMQVFAVAATTTGVSADAEDLEVPETVDPSELYKVRESLEKYTEALREGKDASGLGLGTGVPSLAEGEMDEEVDSSIGKTAYVTWVQSDGLTPAWSQATATIPVQILSTPLPGAARPKSSSPTVQHGISLVTKSNVDGLVFLLEQDPSTTGGEASSSMLPLIWTHTSTYPALAFVLASKQDTRFTHHTPYGVLAFDNGSSQNRGGNVYIYWKQKHVSDAVGKTGVLTITNGYQGGSLLGVGSVYVGGKEDETMEAVRSAPSAHEKKEMLVVCLTEKQLVVIRGLGKRVPSTNP